MKRSIPLAARVLGIVLLAGALLVPVTIVEVRPDDGQPVACHRLGSGETIDVSFTHSMYGGLVTEHWRADGSTLVRVRMVTENAAAAEYYAWDGRIQPVAGGYEVTGAAVQATELRVMVDDIGDHQLQIGSRSWPLAGLLDTPVPVGISVERRPLAAWLVDRSC